MLVIPAVDILKGKCVRLFRGDPKKIKVYYEDPLESAQLLETQGAQLIHIIDLDAALGSGQNMQAITRILENISVNVQIGGGIRTLQKAVKRKVLRRYRAVIPKNTSKVRSWRSPLLMTHL